MYLKPKKVSYSFRIDPELLENFKLYAKAKNLNVPELLNQMIAQEIGSKHLTNDYLPNNLKNIIISIPPLEDLNKETDLILNSNSSIILEVEKIPNNLDKWSNFKGYTGGKNIKHKGIEFVLLPELILHADYHIIEKPDLLEMVLLPIFFVIDEKDQLLIRNTSYKMAIEQIKYSQNIPLLNHTIANHEIVKQTINQYTNLLNNYTIKKDGYYYTGGFSYINKDELLKDLWSKLLVELDELTESINTNVIKHLDGTTIYESNEPLDSYDPYLLSDEIDKLKIELVQKENENTYLRTENEAITSKLNNIQKEINELYTAIENSIKEAENREARAETWKNFHE